MKKITMQDIADKLGISKSLVSISLNNRYGVSDEMRFKIFLTAIEMGYDFNYNYKKKGNSHRNNVVVFIRKDELLANGYWSELLAGAEHLLNENNLNLRLEVWDDSTTANMILVRIVESNADGVIVMNEIPEQAIISLEKLNIPTVFVDSKGYTDRDFDTVRTNNYLGGYLVAEYFEKMGHHRLAYVGDKSFSISFRERYYGFKNYIDEHQDLTFSGYIFQNAFALWLPNEKSNIRDVLMSDIHPTALFCANDDIARYVYGEVAKLGLKILDDVSIIGFDNLVSSSLISPSLTSVNVLKHDLGQSAVQLLLFRMRFKTAPKKAVLLSVNLDIKNSVKKIAE